MKRGAIILVALALVLLLVSLAGALNIFAGERSKVELSLLTAPAGRPLRIALGADPPSLDPSIASDTTSHMVIDQAFETLLRCRGDGSVEPAGAVTYTISADATVYTFTLGSDAYWWDGQPVLASDYVYGLIRLLAPATGAEYAYLYYVIQGAEDYNTGTNPDPNSVGIQALGNYTLEVTLHDPASFFPSIAAMPVWVPLRQDIIEIYGSAWTQPEHYMSNGPYRLQSFASGSQIVMVKNDFYHDADSVFFEEVIFPIISSYEDQLTAYENGELEVSEVPSSQIDYILSDPVLSQELHSLPRPGTWYLGLNTVLTPTNQLLVRKALASAIDRRYILDEVLNMPWREEATGVIPPEIPGYQGTSVGYTFNITAAQQYLSDAGYPNGAGFPGAELWYNYGNEDVIEAVAQMWRDNLNIPVTTAVFDWELYLNLLDYCHDNPTNPACDYNAYRMGWVMDYADAWNILNDVFHPDSTFQYTHWQNADYELLLSLTLTETNQATRIGYYQDAERILVEDAVAVIPVYFYDRTALIKSDVHFEYPPFGAPHLMKWWLIDTSTAEIPPEGGELTSPNLDITLEFPAGTFTATVVVTYTQESAVPTGDLDGIGSFFSLTATLKQTGQPIFQCNQPYTVTVSYSEGELGLVNEDTLALYWREGDQWSKEPTSTVDENKNIVTATPNHMSLFAVLGETERVYLPLILKNY